MIGRSACANEIQSYAESERTRTAHSPKRNIVRCSSSKMANFPEFANNDSVFNASWPSNSTNVHRISADVWNI